MKHIFVERFESSIFIARMNAQEILKEFKRGDYDFGQENFEVIDEISASEYQKLKDKAEKRLSRDIDRVAEMDVMVSGMILDDDGLYSEKDFNAMLSKTGDDGILISDIEGLIGEMCCEVIPDIVDHGLGKYAESCLRWLNIRDNYEKKFFIDPKIVQLLEGMAEAHSLKMKFCDGNNIQKRSVAL